MGLSLKPVLQYQLGHVKSRTVDYRPDRVKSTTEYLVRRIELTRPPEGSVVETRACTYCRTEVRIQVTSVKEARKRRLRDFAWGVVVLLIVVGIASLVLVVPEGAVIPVVLVAILVFLFALGLFHSALTDSCVDWHPTFRARLGRDTSC